jgi:hypothetical protein
MTVKQLSVFLENKSGKLAELAEVLFRHQIDMRATSMAETNDFGILRVIVDDAYKTAQVLKEEGYVFSITPVIAVAVPDTPGGLIQILNILKEEEVNLEYMYAFTARKENEAYMIFRVEEPEKAQSALTKRGIKLVCQDELNRL